MDFKDAEKIAVTLMSKYGLIENGWRFEWDGAVRRVGATRFRGNGDRSISMSAVAVKNAPEILVWETMLHEIAHALLDPKEAHNQVWVDTFRRLLDENGLENLPVSRTAKIGNIVNHRYVATCDHCGTKYGRHRATSRAVACSKCCRRANGGKFHAEFVLNFLDSRRGNAYVGAMTNTKCHDCKRRPIDTDTAGRDSTLCTECYEYAGYENSHIDNGHDAVFSDMSDAHREEIADCPVCQHMTHDEPFPDCPPCDQRVPVPPARKGHTNKNAAGRQMSHAACDHENSKAARAKCRAARAKS